LSAYCRVFYSAAHANPIAERSIGSRHLHVLTQT
jgi:hypothetical protein